MIISSVYGQDLSVAVQRGVSSAWEDGNRIVHTRKKK